MVHRPAGRSVANFTRECLVVEVDTSLISAQVVAVLDRLVQVRGAPAIISADNGSVLLSGRSPARIVRSMPGRRDIHADQAKMGRGPVSCPSCGHENPVGARFCNDCGAHLAALTVTPEPRSYTPRHLVEKILASQSALRGERKLVTVLFADVVRSMELGERVDPEE
jgi:hypothetical protein